MGVLKPEFSRTWYSQVKTMTATELVLESSNLYSYFFAVICFIVGFLGWFIDPENEYEELMRYAWLGGFPLAGVLSINPVSKFTISKTHDKVKLEVRHPVLGLRSRVLKSLDLLKAIHIERFDQVSGSKTKPTYRVSLEFHGTGREVQASNNIGELNDQGLCPVTDDYVIDTNDGASTTAVAELIHSWLDIRSLPPPSWVRSVAVEVAQRGPDDTTALAREVEAAGGPASWEAQKEGDLYGDDEGDEDEDAGSGYSGVDDTDRYMNASKQEWDDAIKRFGLVDE